MRTCELLLLLLHHAAAAAGAAPMARCSMQPPDRGHGMGAIEGLQPPADPAAI